MSIALSGTPTAFGSANNTTDTSVTAACPSTTPGDLILCWLNGATTGTTSFVAPGGWTPIDVVAVDSGTPSLTGALWYRLVQGGDTASPVWTFNGSNVTGVMVAYSGVDQTTPINAGKVDVNPNTGTPKTTPTITTTADGWVVSFSGDRNGGGNTANTDTFRVQSVHSASTATWVQDSNGDVVAGPQTRTWTGPSTSIGTAAIVGLKPAATPGIPVQAAVGTGAAAPAGAYSGPVGAFFAQMWAGVKTYVAHRLGSASLVEHTMAAALTLIELRVAAMEISMWMTTDGVWLASHDRTTDRMFGTTGGNVSCDIPTSTYAQVLAATPNGTIVGGYPIAKVTDLLDVIPATTVVFVDNKRSTDITAWLAMLTAYPNAANRFVSKSYYTSYNTVAAQARLLGFKVWLYNYEADLAGLPSAASAADVYGMEYNASGAAWSAVLAYGPALAHVCLTNANQAQGFASGASGVMTGLVYNGLPNVPVGPGAGTGAVADGNVTPQALPPTGAGGPADGNVITQAVPALGTGSAGDATVSSGGTTPGMYASVAKLKVQLGIPPADTTRDQQLQDVLLAVSKQIDLATDRPRGFSLATGIPTTRTFRASDTTVSADAEGQVLAVDDIGSTIGLVVQYGTASGGYSTFAAGDVELSPVGSVDDGWPATGVLLLGRGWPAGGGTRIRITADWGWPAGAMATIDQAALIQGARVFKRKDSPEGVLGSAEWGSLRISRVDPDVEAMLQPFRLHIALVG